MTDRPLTTKQRIFTDGIVKGLTGIQAAIEAGYKGSGNVLMAIASQNLRKLKIKKAIDSFRAEIKQESKDAIAQLIEDWQELRKRCKEKDRSTEEARCLENISKHYGFYLEDNKQKAEQISLDKAYDEEAMRIARIINLEEARKGHSQATG